MAAIASGVLLAPLAGLGGFGGAAATSPAAIQRPAHSAVRPELLSVTDLTVTRSGGQAVGVALNWRSGTR